ncbi:MAG: GAF domain-containing sensor histidine kinase [Limisphaerales bacterium]
MSAAAKMSRVRPSSIATLVIIALVTVTTLVLAAFGVVNYRSQAKEHWNDLRFHVKADAEQVAAALALPLWNFDRPQIDRVVKSTLTEPALVGVRLDEAAARNRRTVWVRDSDGVVQQTNTDFPTNELLLEVRTVKASPDTVLGTVELYATPMYTRAQLRHELAVTIVRIVAVDVVLSLALYLVLYRWVINPLKTVQQYAVAVSSGSATNRDMGSERFIGELEVLRRAIKESVGELELRYTEKEKAELALRQQAAFDELITRVMTRFVSATAGEIDGEVITGLSEMAQFVGVESAVVIQVAPDRGTWSVTHEWCAPTVGSRMGRFQNVPMGESPWVEDRLVADEPVAIGSRDEIPPQATEERARWDTAGVKAILHVPLRARGGLMNGALSLVSFSRDIDWQQADVPRLRILSNAIANTLERKKAEELVLQSREQLRALSGRLQSLREEERTRLSREIHDHLGQLLTALKFDLRSVERKVAALQDGEARNVLNNKLASAQKLADETLVSVQKIASELRPGILDRVGLAAAIESEVRAFQSRTGVQCECKIPTDTPPIPQEHATAAYRICQELLTNIARHAKATHVRVGLGYNNGWLVLEVRDDGVGIRSSEIDNPESLGILGVHERAAMLGGTTTFEGSPGEGTTVIVTMPFQRTAELAVNS